MQIAKSCQEDVNIYHVADKKWWFENFVIHIILMLCSFCHKLNGSGFNQSTYFKHISDKHGKMIMDVVPNGDTLPEKWKTAKNYKPCSYTSAIAHREMKLICQLTGVTSKGFSSQ